MANKHDDKQNSCKHGCNCDCEDGHDFEELDVINITLEDDSELECGVIGIFEIEDKSYIALIPLEDDQILLYEYLEDEEGIRLDTIKEEEEFELVSEAFYTLFMEDEDIEDYDLDEEDDFEELEDE